MTFVYPAVFTPKKDGKGYDAYFPDLECCEAAFCICNHAWDDPIKQITTRSQKENLNVATPKIGEIIDYSHIETYQEHWWENVE